MGKAPIPCDGHAFKEKPDMSYTVSIKLLNRKVAQFDVSYDEAEAFARSIGMSWPANDGIKGDTITIRKI